MVVLIVLCLGCLNFYAVYALYTFSYFFCYVLVMEWPPIGKIAAHSSYDVFS